MIDFLISLFIKPDAVVERRAHVERGLQRGDASPIRDEKTIVQNNETRKI